MAVIDKSKLKDTLGRPLTQGLFLEISYDTKYAVFTLDDEDKTYKDVLYPSLKKLYLDLADVTEYQFAKKHLLGWKHWRRLNDNNVLRAYFDDWREELEVAMRSEAILSIVDMTTSDQGNFQAAKWLADRGWDKRGAGRPSKAELDREKRINDKIGDELGAEIIRMSSHLKEVK